MPDSVDGRRRLAPEQRKRLLLEHAVDAFATRGIGRGSHTDIATLGSVSVATAFNYFKTREDLVEAVLDEIETLLTDLVQKTLNGYDDPRQGLRACCHAVLDLASEKPAYIKVWLEWSASIRDETMASHLLFDKKLTHTLAAHLRTAMTSGAISSNINPDVNAFWLLGQTREITKQLFYPTPCVDVALTELLDQSLDELLPAA